MAVINIGEGLVQHVISLVHAFKLPGAASLRKITDRPTTQVRCNLEEAVSEGKPQNGESRHGIGRPSCGESRDSRSSGEPAK
tara:strand:+ start:94 stop:339 length:246 start_codon:yes stop_codon:yes gene_type:complete